MRILFRASALVLCVCAPMSALAQAAAIDPDHLDFQVAPGDGSAVKANADIKGGSPDLESDLQLTLSADPSLPGGDPFRQATAPLASHEGVGFNTSWNALKGVKLDLSFGDRLDQTWRAVSLGLINDHQISVDDHSANVGLSLSPLSAVDLNLTGSADEKTVLDVASGQSLISQPHSQFATTSQSAGAGLKWRLASWFNLEAKGKMEAGDASWRGAPAGAAVTGADLSYAYFEPALIGALKTPGQGDLSLTFERAVSPLDEGAFSTFAAVEDRASDARLGPNREWRYRLNYSQKLAGQVQLSAALTQARIESATELGPVGPDLQAPISVTGGERQEANVSLSTPLSFLGLPSFTLNGAGDWKSSQVRDPFTGELRRASGESPQMATLGLTQFLAGGGASWGLVGHFGGDRSLWQMNQVTNVSVADSLSGFVEYRPGSFALRLQVDGLYGGERNATDLYYEGARTSGFVDRVDHHLDDGQAVRLILSKAL
jgi:hypothetical protein